MSHKYFRVKLRVEPKRGGGAELAVPKSFGQLEWAFCAVKDGGEEAVIRVKADDEAITGALRDAGASELGSKQAKELIKSYPAAKLKQKLRSLEESSPEPYTVQLVRAGFFIIDVPVQPLK